jgi:hypothetical protein
VDCCPSPSAAAHWPMASNADNKQGPTWNGWIFCSQLLLLQQ